MVEATAIMLAGVAIGAFGVTRVLDGKKYGPWMVLVGLAIFFCGVVAILS